MMPDVTVRAKKTFLLVGLALLVMAVVTIGAQLILGLAVSLYKMSTGVDLMSRPWMLWLLSFVPMYLLGIPLGLLILHYIPAVKAPSCRLGGGNFWLFLIMCFPLLYGGNLLGALLSGLFSGGAAENGLMEYINSPSPLKILVIVFLAPMLEEYVFRKQLIDRVSRYGEKTAVLFSALMFGIFHMNLFQFFYAFAIGLLLAYVYLRTRRLRYSVLLHMIINFMGSVVAPFIASQATPIAADATALPQLSPGLLLVSGFGLLVLGLSVAGIVLLIIKLRRLVFVPALEELPKGARFRTVYCNAGVLLFLCVCLAVCALSLFVS